MPDYTKPCYDIFRNIDVVNMPSAEYVEEYEKWLIKMAKIFQVPESYILPSNEKYKKSSTKDLLDSITRASEMIYKNTQRGEPSDIYRIQRGELPCFCDDTWPTPIESKDNVKNDQLEFDFGDEV